MSEDVIKALLSSARELYERALREFEEAVARNDVIGIRDSAEKAWNAVVQAINALIIYYTGVTPMSHFERRRKLRELEKSVREVGELGLADRYMARFGVLHGETFYEGVIDVEQLRDEMVRVGRIIGDVEKLVLRSP
ncbi:MAG: PaREP1 family protein [Desulfurococcales archaeon]|nr:PaREP1 family protein [Desulfurococcales archaeon]